VVPCKPRSSKRSANCLLSRSLDRRSRSRRRRCGRNGQRKGRRSGRGRPQGNRRRRTRRADHGAAARASSSDFRRATFRFRCSTSLRNVSAFVGTREDMAACFALAAAGEVKADIELSQLSNAATSHRALSSTLPARSGARTVNNRRRRNWCSPSACVQRESNRTDDCFAGSFCERALTRRWLQAILSNESHS